MAGSIAVDDFRRAFLALMEETFEREHNYYLDSGASLFETLADVSAEEASKRISAHCACLAAQVNHTRFYLDVMAEYAATGEDKAWDWDGSWNVGPVDDAEWADLIARLRASYEGTVGFVKTFDGWDANFIGGAFSILAHCAYHLGEIRQGLGVLRG
jgi:hypothetical protein